MNSIRISLYNLGFFLLFNLGFQNMGIAQQWRLSERFGKEELTFLDGSIWLVDSLDYEWNRIRIFKELGPKNNRKLRFISAVDYPELFSIRSGPETQILYHPEINEPSVNQVTALIHGRQMANRDFRKWTSYSVGFVTGFGTGGFIGTSYVAIPLSFGSTYAFSKLPVGRKRMNEYPDTFFRKGYRKEIREKRFMPFLLSNLVGTIVGLIVSPKL